MKKTITTLALANCLLSFPGVQAMDAVQSADLAPVVVLREVEDQQDRKIAEAPRLEIPVVPIEAPTPALTNLKDGCGYLLLGALNGGKAVVSVVDAATNFLGGAFNAVAGVANYIRAVSAESDADRVALLKSADTNLTGAKDNMVQAYNSGYNAATNAVGFVKNVGLSLNDLGLAGQKAYNAAGPVISSVAETASTYWGKLKSYFSKASVADEFELIEVAAAS